MRLENSRDYVYCKEVGRVHESMPATTPSACSNWMIKQVDIVEYDSNSGLCFFLLTQAGHPENCARVPAIKDAIQSKDILGLYGSRVRSSRHYQI